MEDKNNKKEENKKITRVTSGSENEGFTNGDLDDLDENNELKCYICGKNIDDPVEAYSYNLVHDNSGIYIDEFLFCSKKCWEEHILREAERIRIDSGLKKAGNSKLYRR